MALPQWPAAEKRLHIGKRIDRLDGPVKVTGTAKYAEDIHPKGMLFAKMLGSRYAAATISAVDVTAAAAMPGVQATWVNDAVLENGVQYQGQIIAALCAETEEQAHEALKAIKVDYVPSAPSIIDNDPALAEGRGRTKDAGDVEAALAAAATKTEGEYGCPVITHCCLEPHGQVSELQGENLKIWPSTQSVSAYADRMDEPLGIPQSNIHVECQYMGGGFGSKFPHDIWGIVCSKFTLQTKRPVKLLLERDLELMIAGNRPSAYANIKVGLDAAGKITAFDGDVWGTAGMGGYRGAAELPYIFTKVPNTRFGMNGIRTNRATQRAWRAPGHPQGCLLTMAALEDAAAAAKMDALEFFLLNAELTDRPEVYREQLKIAADMIDYKAKAHLRGEGAGTIRRGLGISMHTWGGMGHPSECEVSINPDGSVEMRQGTQDLGVGTRTVLNIVIADTLGLPLDAVKVNIGRNDYPTSGGSGGSTTVGGISASSRIAATNALNKVLEKAAPELGVPMDQLEASNGRIQVIGDPSKGMTWKEACALIGPMPIKAMGVNEIAQSREMKLIDAGVGGVQIADVSVDMETGIVTMNEMVAVQDCGLIIDLKTTESQVLGALIMGITYSLYEECVYDPTTGRMLNADMEFYRLAGIKDVGELKVHMMTGPGYDERGVIGIGEPPVISPGAAISNAVANACGVRVPQLPLTPDRVIAALEKGGIA